MKKLCIALLICVIVLVLFVIFQQIELYAIADEINRLNEFVDGQIALNEVILDIIEIL